MKHQDIEQAKAQVQTQMNEKMKDCQEEVQKLKNSKEKLMRNEKKLEGRIS